MQFDDLEAIDTDLLQERLSSWRRMPDVVQKRPDSLPDTGVNETELRVRQRRIGNMALTSLQLHAAFYAQLEAFVQQPGRSSHHQQRVEDWAAFTLGVYEQSNALLLQRGIEQELDGLPKEVIQTVSIQPPPPPKSWFRRLLGS
jgi:hypothetical protein